MVRHDSPKRDGCALTPTSLWDLSLMIVDDGSLQVDDLRFNSTTQNL
jgi:hypothetical protein